MIGAGADQPRPWTRAKDSDRDAVIDVLNGAFTDGQLDSDEHQRRIGIALSAATVGSLAGLTVDLQLSGRQFADLAAKGLVPYPPPTAPVASPTGAVSSRPGTKLVWHRGRLAALAGVLLLVAGSCTVLSINASQGTTDDFSYGSGPAEVYRVFTLDVDSFDTFVADYARRFQTTDALRVDLREGTATVLVPSDDGADPQRYTYDGSTFTRAVPQVPTSDDTFDLAEVDAPAIEDLARDAPDRVGIDDPESVVVTITPAGGAIRVVVRVTGTDGRTGSVVADANGKVTKVQKAH